VWDAATGRELSVLRGHSGSVESVSFSADGKQVVTAGADGTARVWDAAVSRESSVLRGFLACLHSILQSGRATGACGRLWRRPGDLEATTGKQVST